VQKGVVLIRRPVTSSLAAAICVALSLMAFPATAAAAPAVESGAPPVRPAAASGEAPFLTFEFPKPAITGSEFTIRPVYPDGYVIPADALCRWRLRWGDDASLFEGRKNDTFGEVQFQLRPADGGCNEWTFTLPYGPALRYQYLFEICMPSGCAYSGSAEDRSLLFTAAYGTMDRHIWHSNLPVAYVLPSTYNATVGEPVTYTVYGSDDYVPPSNGDWHTSCVCYIGLGPTQWGGTTFTFTPWLEGHWTVGWSIFPPRGLERSASFDPPARLPDSTKPVAKPPVARIYGSAARDVAVPAQVTWSGSDQGWGIERYELQRSLDGAGWRRITLSSPLAKQAIQWLGAGHTYRYRARAVDKAGNVSAWATGPFIRGRIVSDGAASVTYSGTWAVQADSGALGAALHWSTESGASLTHGFSARGVAYVAQRGPDRGRARVMVDGVLVATVDLRAATEQDRRIVWRRHWSVRGDHVIRIVVEGTTGRPTVTADGLLLLR
jgi:hypothetical protein